MVVIRSSMFGYFRAEISNKQNFPISHFCCSWTHPQLFYPPTRPLPLLTASPRATATPQRMSCPPCPHHLQLHRRLTLGTTPTTTGLNKIIIFIGSCHCYFHEVQKKGIHSNNYSHKRCLIIVLSSLYIIYSYRLGSVPLLYTV